MDTILVIHSINRWLIVTIGAIAALRFLVGWVSKSQFREIDRGLMMAYTGLIDLQLILGIVLLIGMGIARYRIEHAVMMIIALILAHLSRLWRDKPATVRFRFNFMAIFLGLLLIFAGVTLLPQGWTFG